MTEQYGRRQVRVGDTGHNRDHNEIGRFLEGSSLPTDLPMWDIGSPYPAWGDLDEETKEKLRGHDAAHRLITSCLEGVGHCDPTNLRDHIRAHNEIHEAISRIEQMERRRR